MKLNIVVDEPDDYVAWFAAQSPVSQNADLMASFKQMSKQTGLGKGGSQGAKEAATEEAGETPAPLAAQTSM